MLKILFKIWPALTVILLYIMWVFLVKRKSEKNSKKSQSTEYEIVAEKKKETDFSLSNKIFFMVVFISLILTILSFIYIVSKQEIRRNQQPYSELIKNVKTE